MHFKNHTSIHKTFDSQPWSVSTPRVLDESLDVCSHDGYIYTMSNQSMFVLQTHQVMNLHEMSRLIVALREHANTDRSWFAREPEKLEGINQRNDNHATHLATPKGSVILLWSIMLCIVNGEQCIRHIEGM